MAFVHVGNAGLDPAEAIATHGLIGAAAAAAQGGDPVAGFAAAALTKSFTLGAEGFLNDINNDAIESLIAGAVGGTISEVTGGKFANGAITAAIGYAYNQRGDHREEDSALSKRIEIITGRGNITAFSFRTASIGHFSATLEIFVHSDEGAFLGTKEVDVSAPLGGLGKGVSRFFGLQGFNFDFLLKGPAPVGFPGNNAIIKAFDNQQLRIAGVSAALGVGLSIGTLEIGRFQSPDPITGVQGIALSADLIGGTINVNDIQCKPKGFR